MHMISRISGISCLSCASLFQFCRGASRDISMDALRSDVPGQAGCDASWTSRAIRWSGHESLLSPFQPGQRHRRMLGRRPTGAAIATGIQHSLGPLPPGLTHPPTIQVNHAIHSTITHLHHVRSGDCRENCPDLTVPTNGANPAYERQMQSQTLQSGHQCRHDNKALSHHPAMQPVQCCEDYLGVRGKSGSRAVDRRRGSGRLLAAR